MVTVDFYLLTTDEKDILNTENTSRYLSQYPEGTIIDLHGPIDSKISLA
jgi:hypothetical protein